MGVGGGGCYSVVWFKGLVSRERAEEEEGVCVCVCVCGCLERVEGVSVFVFTFVFLCLVAFFLYRTAASGGVFAVFPPLFALALGVRGMGETGKGKGTRVSGCVRLQRRRTGGRSCFASLEPAVSGVRVRNEGAATKGRTEKERNQLYQKFEGETVSLDRLVTGVCGYVLLLLLFLLFTNIFLSIGLFAGFFVVFFLCWEMWVVFFCFFPLSFLFISFCINGWIVLF